jgi:LuxR family maltose regulon positive regulatory protein
MSLHYARGVLRLVLGRYEEGLADLQAAERLAGMLATPHTNVRWMRAHTLQALAQLGQTERVEAALAGLSEGDRGSAEMRTALALLRLAQHEPQAAATALAPIMDGSVHAFPKLWMVTALYLEAIARDALGDQDAAGRALERALDVAESDRVLIPFLVYPAPGLLELHARQRIAHAALIAEILDLLAPGEPTRAGSSSEGGPEGMGPPGKTLREPLSQAETRVLRYLPTGLSVAEIAGELYLSVNTVRTHMRHVYDKLGAHRRHEAVERARVLGLLAQSPHAT